MRDSPTRTAGILYALAAYGTWGVAPVFWKLLVAVPAVEVLAHRILWGMLVFLLLLVWRRRFAELVMGFKDRRLLGVFVLTGLLVAANWYIYIVAVATGKILEGSLGYFVNPLFNVVLGMVFLGERLRAGQWAAVALAAAGVAQLAARTTGFPWLAVGLVLTFGIYGLLRKVARADALLGSNLETAILVPGALGLLAWLTSQGRAAALHADARTLALLAGTGLMTALPLLWFSNAARRLPLSDLGFFQYLAPSGQFLLAVFVYDEPFTNLELRAFACIWIALVVFTVEARLARR